MRNIYSPIFASHDFKDYISTYSASLHQFMGIDDFLKRQTERNIVKQAILPHTISSGLAILLFTNIRLKAVNDEKGYAQALANRRRKRHADLRRTAAVDDNLTVWSQGGDIGIDIGGKINLHNAINALPPRT